MQKKSIEQLGETRWRVFAQVNGRRKNKIVNGSERAAQRELEQMRVLMTGAEYVDPKTAPTVRDAFDEFLVTQNQRVLDDDGVKEGEYDNKERHKRQFCGVKIDGLLVGNMKTTDITADLVIDKILPKLKVGRANPTVRKLFVNVQQAFDFFVRKRWCVLNPADGVKISTRKGKYQYQDNLASKIAEEKNAKVTRRRISPSEMQFVISHAPGKYCLAIEFAAYTGMRQGEQRALVWDDINFEDSHVRVRRAIKKRSRGSKKKSVVGEPKTEAGVRSIPLMPFIDQSLRERKVKQTLEQRANNLVFPDEIGEVASGETWLDKGITRACDAARIKRMTWLDLRHFYASVLIFSSELNDSTITEFLGHSSIAFSKKEYARWFKDRKRDEKIATKLGAAFGR